MRGPRALVAPAMLLLLLAAAPGAAAQAAPSTLDAETPAPPLVRPGEAAELTFTVRWCYRTATPVPATVRVTPSSGEPWLSATVEPATFPASGSDRCGARDLALRVRVGRDAPAFDPRPLDFHLQATGTGGDRIEATASLLVQAEYWADLTIDDPPVVRVIRGDQGIIPFRVRIGANEATRLEITGSEPGNKVNLLGVIVNTLAGRGLDAVDTRDLALNVTVSPGADPGTHTLTITVVSQNVRQPSIRGEEATVRAMIEVVGTGLPGPAPALVLLAVLPAALLLARGARRRRRQRQR